MGYKFLHDNNDDNDADNDDDLVIPIAQFFLWNRQAKNTDILF